MKIVTNSIESAIDFNRTGDGRRLLAGSIGWEGDPVAINRGVLANLWGTYSITPVHPDDFASLLDVLEGVVRNRALLTLSIASGALDFLTTVSWNLAQQPPYDPLVNCRMTLHRSPVVVGEPDHRREHSWCNFRW